jgi:cysteine desulfurase/selenocysteine lyase
MSTSFCSTPQLLKEIRGLRLIGTAPEMAGVPSFGLGGFRTEDVGSARNAACSMP